MRGALAVLLLVACGGDEGGRGGPDAGARPSFSLAASGTSIAVGTRGELEVGVVGHHGFAGEVEVRLEGLPEGVSAAPVVIAAGGTGLLEIQVLATAENGERRARVRGQAGALEASREVELVLRGRPGDLDRSFSSDGLAALAHGQVAALDVDGEGRAVVCVDDGDGFRLRRLRRDGSDDGELTRGSGTCLDVVAWPDGEVVVLFHDTRPRLLRVGAAEPVALPDGAEALGLARSGETLLIAGTHPDPGIWKLDRELASAGFGFATAPTPWADARGRAVVERADGSLVLVVHSEAESLYSLLAFTPAGEPPDFEPPAFAVEALGRPELHALADGRLWMADGAAHGFEVFFADETMTELRRENGLTSPVDQPARAHALAGHPGGGAVVVGSAAGDLVWTRFDQTEQRVDSFRHRQPMGALAAARAVAALPDGRLLVAGDVGEQHVVLRIWP